MKKNITITFKDYASQYSPEHLKENYKEVVKEFIVKDGGELKRKVKPPMILKTKQKDHILVSYYSLEQYKAMTQEAINTPLANRDEVINKLLDNYINKPLKGNASDAAKIYDNITSIAGHSFIGDKFLYYSRLIAVEELIKFELYLLGGCKENKKKAGRKSIPKKTAEAYLKVSEDDQEIFLNKLKQKFNKSTPKKFAYFIISLENLKLIEINSKKNIFEAFTEAFGGAYGTQTNFDNHFRSPNDNKLLESTKKKINDIKNTNVIF